MLIALSMVVLMAALVLLLISRSGSNVLMSNASAHAGTADLYAHGAINQIIGDLKQEIAAGSTVASVTPSTGGVASIASPSVVYTNPTTGSNSYIYRPSQFANAVPAFQGSATYSTSTLSGQATSYSTTLWNAEFPNLLKESTRNVAFYPAAGHDANAPTRAASVNTTNDAAIGGRYISLQRWNEHLLLPKASATISTTAANGTVISDDSTDTAPSNSFVPPDWIYTAADGSNPTTLNSSASDLTNSNINPQSRKYIIGRYAYAIYNEGGLLDVNAAGTPNSGTVTGNDLTVWSHKGPEAFADLTQLPGIQQVSSLTPVALVNQLVGWRNRVTANPSGTFPSYTFTGPFSGTSSSYFNTLMNLSTGFMSTANTSVVNGQTDHLFTSRQQMINFFQNLITNSSDTADKAHLQDAMMYLTPFSRYLNQPTYWPDPNRPTVVDSLYGSSIGNGTGNVAYQADNNYNPPLAYFRVTSTGWTRPSAEADPMLNPDASTPVMGEPLIKKRFPLDRLCWVTCEGPSASLASGNPIISAYLNDGISQQVISQGTAANIQAYFGLSWTNGPGGAGAPGGYWTYNHGFSSGTGVAVGLLKQVAALSGSNGREPDFFELMVAALSVGELGKSFAPLPLVTAPVIANFWAAQQKTDGRVDEQVLQIGANMLDQINPTCYPTRIFLPDSVYPRMFSGVQDLPYLYALGSIVVQTVAPNPAPPSNGASVAITSTTQLVAPGNFVMLQVPLIWNPTTYNANAPSGTGYAPTNLRIGAVNAVASDAIAGGGIFTTVNSYQMFGISTDTSTASQNLPRVFSDWAPINLPGWSLDKTSTGSYTGVLDYSATAGSYYTANGTLVSAPNTEMTFNNVANLYREPTPLVYPGGAPGLAIDIHNLIQTQGNFTVAGVPDNSTPSRKLLGFFQQQDPICWTGTYNGNSYIFTASLSGGQPNPGSNPLTGTTYSLEYQVGSNWIPYQQAIVAQSGESKSFAVPFQATSPTNPLTVFNGNQISGSMCADPRTSRLGYAENYAMPPFTDSTDTVTYASQHGIPPGTTVPDEHVNYSGTQSDMFMLNRTATWPDLFDGKIGSSSTGWYVSSPDLVVRRGMGAYNTVSLATTVGLPLDNESLAANAATNAYNRPIMLHRPFRSVAELGYVFSDMPWHNLSMFTPESSYGALLDLFCVSEDYRPDAVEAGRVDLNTRQAPVLQALLNGTYRDENGSLSPLASSEAIAISQALVKRTSVTANQGPLTNVADLVGRYVSGTASTSTQPTYDGFSGDLAGNSLYAGTATSPNRLVPRLLETSMRALSDAGQAGNWNLMIDVIAQSGRFPSNSTTGTSMANFLVEGEKHYWVHVAINRTTGAVIDENVEPVNE